LVFAPGEAPSALAARLQADVRQILLEAGLAVTNSQVLPLRKDDQFDRVGVKLTAKGSLNALDAALIGLAAYEPKLIIESLDTFPAATGRRNEPEETQQLTAVFQLTVLKEAL
jgi:general secretion pathway protein M